MLRNLNKKLPKIVKAEKSKIYGRDRISQTLVKVTKRLLSNFRQSLVLLLRFFDSWNPNH